ncbi:hypothetical protein EVG20_g1447 [Dentipellis fragilis]|uniref:Uncharacterized protein n=1 Tax=Dentipellis fragilis TaxID=205917 RepID=A0A4Y9ZBQ4_9AGAM|nr:hypothetical protein EVG20_g1447 [Dentipellis fragilis]
MSTVTASVVDRTLLQQRVVTVTRYDCSTFIKPQLRNPNQSAEFKASNADGVIALTQPIVRTGGLSPGIRRPQQGNFGNSPPLTYPTGNLKNPP